MTTLKFVGAIAYLAGVPALCLFLSGNWQWREGWIFGAWYAALCGLCLGWLYFKDPALLAERFRKPGTGGETRSDMVLLLGIKLGCIAWLLVPPLDVRFGWTPHLPRLCEIAGGILLLPAGFFFFRAFTDNPYLSQLVRIQAERGQRVVDTGVYGVVRHPMYLGAGLMFLGSPLLLGSLAGLLVGLGVILLLVVRIFGEEELLVHDLDGYRAYRQKVRYRLLPRLW